MGSHSELHDRSKPSDGQGQVIVRDPTELARAAKPMMISDIISENVHMQAVMRHAQQTAHEAQHLRPPCMEPWTLSKLPKDDGRRDALSKMTQLAEE